MYSISFVLFHDSFVCRLLLLLCYIAANLDALLMAFSRERPAGPLAAAYYNPRSDPQYLLLRRRCDSILPQAAPLQVVRPALFPHITRPTRFTRASNNNSRRPDQTRPVPELKRSSGHPLPFAGPQRFPFFFASSMSRLCLCHLTSSSSQAALSSSYYSPPFAFLCTH